MAKFGADKAGAGVTGEQQDKQPTGVTGGDTHVPMPPAAHEQKGAATDLPQRVPSITTALPYEGAGYSKTITPRQEVRRTDLDAVIHENLRVAGFAPEVAEAIHIHQYYGRDTYRVAIDATQGTMERAGTPVGSPIARDGLTEVERAAAHVAHAALEGHILPVAPPTAVMVDMVAGRDTGFVPRLTGTPDQDVETHSFALCKGIKNPQVQEERGGKKKKKDAEEAAAAPQQQGPEPRLFIVDTTNVGFSADLAPLYQAAFPPVFGPVECLPGMPKTAYIANRNVHNVEGHDAMNKRDCFNIAAALVDNLQSTQQRGTIPQDAALLEAVSQVSITEKHKPADMPYTGDRPVLRDVASSHIPLRRGSSAPLHRAARDLDESTEIGRVNKALATGAKKGGFPETQAALAPYGIHLDPAMPIPALYDALSAADIQGKTKDPAVAFKNSLTKVVGQYGPAAFAGVTVETFGAEIERIRAQELEPWQRLHNSHSTRQLAWMQEHPHPTTEPTAPPPLSLAAAARSVMQATSVLDHGIPTPHAERVVEADRQRQQVAVVSTAASSSTEQQQGEPTAPTGKFTASLSPRTTAGDRVDGPPISPKAVLQQKQEAQQPGRDFGVA